VFAAGAPREWGWHSLTDEWAARIVADAEIRPHDLVLDVGAGRGALTRHLLAAGARVIAVELHPQRIAYLRSRFADTTVTIVGADASNLVLPRRPFRVVASPPYALTSVLLRALLAPRSQLTRADLVLQRAAVRRCVEGGVAGSRGWSGRWTLTAGRSLPRAAFHPPPRVDSAVLTVRRR
jgi:23S rRNA (adenine-N6)-dimethyltransferase